MQLTNREITQQNQKVTRFFEPKRIATDMLIMVAIGLLLGYLGPFGSASALGTLNYAYWVIVCVIGFWVYRPIIYFGDNYLQKYLHRFGYRLALTTLAASIVMSAIVPVLTIAFFQYDRSWCGLFLNSMPKTLAIGGAITIVSILESRLGEHKQQLQASEQLLAEQASALNAHNPLAAGEQFLEQLPANKRGELLAIETQDHYLKVYTDKGRHLILMRLKDALTLLNDYPGLQIHRSWWVANSAITAIEKVDRKTWLVLKNGIKAPVSRTFTADVKKLGWV